MTSAFALTDGPVADIASLTLMLPFLVMAPHPDDETLGCGGLVAHACRLGLMPAIVILTDGGASHVTPGWTRARLVARRAVEAREAAYVLGLPAARLFQLDAADGALAADDTMMAALRCILQDTGARTLFVTDPGDAHPDHRAAFRLAVRLIAEGAADALATYPVSQRIDGQSCGRFERLTVSTDDQLRKSQAIARNQSQLGTLLPPGSGFVLDAASLAPYREPVELFRPIYGLPACVAPAALADGDALCTDSAPSATIDENTRGIAAMQMLGQRQLGRVWEAGAASGMLAEKLLGFCDTLMVSDASLLAVAQVRTRLRGRADVRCLALPVDAPEGPFDLIILSATLHCLGLDAVIETAAVCLDRLAPGGRLLLVSRLGDSKAALTGQESAEALAACVTPALELVAHDCQAGLRLDLYADVGA